MQGDTSHCPLPAVSWTQPTHKRAYGNDAAWTGARTRVHGLEQFVDDCGRGSYDIREGWSPFRRDHCLKKAGVDWEVICFANRGDEDGGGGGTLQSCVGYPRCHAYYTETLIFHISSEPRRTGRVRVLPVTHGLFL